MNSERKRGAASILSGIVVLPLVAALPITIAVIGANAIWSSIRDTGTVPANADQPGPATKLIHFIGKNDNTIMMVLSIILVLLLLGGSLYNSYRLRTSNKQ